MIYVLLGLLIILGTFIEVVLGNRRVSLMFLFATCFTMVLLVGLRDGVGTDWDAYYNFYKDKTDSVEIGYATLNNFFSNLGVSYNVYLLIINSISLFLMYKFIKNNAYFTMVAILIFYSDLFLYFNLSGVRQALAMSLTCYSIVFAVNKRPLLFFLFVTLAVLFHASAFIFVFAYFLPKKNLKIKHILIAVFSFSVLNYFLNSISDLLMLYTQKDVNFYVNVQLKSDSLRNLFIIGTAKRLIIVFVALFYCKEHFEVERFRYFFNIYLFGLAIYLSTYMISPDIGVRMSSYFTVFDVVIAGNVLCAAKRINAKFVIVAIFSMVALYKLIGYMNDEFYVYNSIF